jgi:hypothetical protein
MNDIVRGGKIENHDCAPAISGVAAVRPYRLRGAVFGIAENSAKELSASADITGGEWLGRPGESVRRILRKQRWFSRFSGRDRKAGSHQIDTHTQSQYDFRNACYIIHGIPLQAVFCTTQKTWFTATTSTGKGGRPTISIPAAIL